MDQQVSFVFLSSLLYGKWRIEADVIEWNISFSSIMFWFWLILGQSKEQAEVTHSVCSPFRTSGSKQNNNVVNSFKWRRFETVVSRPHLCCCVGLALSVWHGVDRLNWRASRFSCFKLKLFFKVVGLFNVEQDKIKPPTKQTGLCFLFSRLEMQIH
jgi:hypothetical protein